jgi:LmbE family N-acetylglucosaminyl deacetylase
MNTIRFTLPDVARALVLSPHPDDETLGCGGTIALYSEKIDFTVAAISNGEAVDIPEKDRAALRRKEFAEAMKILGVRNSVFLDFPDGKFSHYSEEIEKKLSELYSSLKPQIVFSPSPFDPHPDHREIALSCIRLAAGFPLVKVAFYEVYGPLRFNTLIDIGNAIDTKKNALSSYRFSMLKKEDIFIEANLALNRSRSLLPLRDSFYEAFWAPDSPMELFDLVSWATYGAVPLSPEDRLLTTLKVADSLIVHIRAMEIEKAEKDSVIDGLRRQADEREARLEENMKTVERSFFWRLARKFYRLRDALFPEGTKSRRVYEKLVGNIKRNRKG